ncbi:MAG: putative zinc-binding metallopeptidase [Bacteroidetes bacterium]|uniref:Zinc-binding metallopeptidase n=1 Tax=Candidatus Cryptobacteroides faecipullorum TaxID=2840764 RepID=A0A9D9NAN0_9BACT|nr:putative zinc-binding metallopeptidase [Candidatus Cryptobacteroides faecipullorum]
MKRILEYMILAVAAVVSAVACSEDKLSPTSVIVDPINPETDFDKWLEENFRAPYNIRFLYRYEDIESDMTYDLVPADETCSRILAKLIKFLWLDPYTEVADANFMRQNSPRVMPVIGSGAWNTNGTLQLGTAEGGLKITFYVANWLVTQNFLTINYNNGVDTTEGYTVTINSMDDINYYFLHTAHHEFGHILNQNKAYPTDFNLISQNEYVAQWNSITDEEALPRGFISAYASSQPGEDFVEVLSYYITSSDEEWNARLAIAGNEGSEIIERKLNIVSNYMMDSWNIDIDELRSVLARRYGEVESIDWSDFSTEE